MTFYHLPLENEWIRLRSVNENDAEFILKIRTDPVFNNFLHKTEPDINKQKNWICSQQVRNYDYYFIIETIQGNTIGTISLYNIDPISGKGELGRWICTLSSLESVASIMLLYDFGFTTLNLNEIYTRTMAGNIKIINFHKSFGASLIDDHEEDPLTGEILIRQTVLNKQYKNIRIKNIRLLEKLLRNRIQ